MDNTALMPCHYSVQFYVEEDSSNKKWLSCHFTMRSNDLMCGFPWNIASYSILTHILARRCGMTAKEIIYSCGDTHIYQNHFGQVERQLARKPRPFPGLWMDESIKEKDWSQMTVDDFKIIGYFPHPSISSPMAI
jgi:thymidylate synthase